MAENLTQQKCKPCEGGVEPLSPEQYQPYLSQISSAWKVAHDKMIERLFTFKDFKAAMEFVNKVADLAENEGHHPDIYLHQWNKVKISLWTHAIDGLSVNDFIVASKIDPLTPAR